MNNKELNELLAIVKAQSDSIRNLHNELDQIQRNCYKERYLYRIVCNGNLMYPSYYPGPYESSDPYTIKTDHEIHPGDIIRSYDDYYNMNAVVVVRREYDVNTHIFYLYCEAPDYKFNDYIFSQEYKSEIGKWIIKNKDKFIEGKQPEARDIIDMVDVLTKHRTSINRDKVLRHTQQILAEMLGYQYKEPVMLDY